jgi:hypothetical protein
MHFRLRTLILTFLVSVVGFASLPASAQDWEVSTTLYLWMAGIDGTLSANERSIEVDQSIGDVLSNLEFGAMGGLRAQNGSWIITGDLIYTGLGASVDQPAAEVDVDMWIVSGDAGYELMPGFEVLGGLRYVSVENKIAFQGPLRITAEAEKSWVDPFFGVRMMPQLNEKWSLLTRVDLGGFDVGSDFTWQFHIHAIREITDNASLAFGYRILSIDYDDEEGANEFGLDLTMHGPSAGLIYRF